MVHVFIWDWFLLLSFPCWSFNSNHVPYEMPLAFVICKVIVKINIVATFQTTFCAVMWSQLFLCNDFASCRDIFFPKTSLFLSNFSLPLVFTFFPFSTWHFFLRNLIVGTFMWCWKTVPFSRLRSVCLKIPALSRNQCL